MNLKKEIQLLKHPFIDNHNLLIKFHILYIAWDSHQIDIHLCI